MRHPPENLPSCFASCLPITLTRCSGFTGMHEGCITPAGDIRAQERPKLISLRSLSDGCWKQRHCCVLMLVPSSRFPQTSLYPVPLRFRPSQEREPNPAQSTACCFNVFCRHLFSFSLNSATDREPIIDLSFPCICAYLFGQGVLLRPRHQQPPSASLLLPTRANTLAMQGWLCLLTEPGRQYVLSSDFVSPKHNSKNMPLAWKSELLSTVQGGASQTPAGSWHLGKPWQEASRF